MVERRIREDEAFPVYDLEGVNGSYTGRVVDVPDDLLVEYEQACAAWEAVQNKLSDLYEQVRAVPSDQWR